MASSSGSKAEFIVGGKYKLVRKIGSGSFGDIYLAINITNGEVRSKPILLNRNSANTDAVNSIYRSCKMLNEAVVFFLCVEFTIC